MLLHFSVALLLTTLLVPTDQQVLNVKTVFKIPSWLIPHVQPSAPTPAEDDVLDSRLAANYVTDGDFYQILVDVSALDPDNIRLTVLDPQTIQVEGRRESRKVDSKFVVPVGYDVDKFSVDIDQNGVLRVAVPRRNI